MTRRGVPTIHPTDLRDHSDSDALERLWEHIESDLSVRESTRLPLRRWPLLAAAALALAFGGGIYAGKLIWKPAVENQGPLVERTTDDQPALDVLAAGTQGRTFPLPGGGRIQLSPGATVEVVRNADSSLSLRLVQGEASVDTTEGQQALAILAGDALLSMGSGSALRMRRNTDDLMDVSVSDGTVNIVSPAGSRRLVRGERVEALPIRTPVSLAPPATVMRHLPVLPHLQSEQPVSEQPKVASAPQADWHAQSNAGNDAEALRLLRSQPDGLRGAIRAARSAHELMDIHDLIMSKGDASEKPFAVTALQRIVESFPDSEYAQIAAYKLGSLYQSTNPAESRRWFERAENLKGPLTEDALCRRFRSARGEEAVRLAKDYLAKYPEGGCKELAERVAGGDNAVEDEEQTTADAGKDAAH